MTPLVALAVLAGVLGLAVGSFLNVVIHRVPAGESVVSPGSHCPGCDTPIKGRHNVPLLGWLVLRGRCASCAEPISARYPLVEAGTAALFVAVTLRLGVTPALPAYLYLAAVGVTLAMIDVDHRWLPDAIVLPSYVVVIGLFMPAAAADGDWHRTWHGLAGMAAFAAIAAGLALVEPLRLGAAEVKLAGLVGLSVGFLSWAALLVAVVVTVLALGAAGPLRALRRRSPVLAGLHAGAGLLSAAAVALFLTMPVMSAYTALLPT